METQRAKEIIRAGLSWADWTDEQKEAFKVAYDAIDNYGKLQFDFNQLNQEWLELATFKRIAEQILTEKQFEKILLEMYRQFEK
ncbi:hypothetical protein FC756_19840 [Lysinibacillus mangiferihumi]|uniref:Uncharacterized protein n=1 Tax=Lysinibacillus mangiferihumi TaxID=1130819 RepID=A0A4U2YHJ8_9BACI|nr:hypothetical protein [Lysinibacillus mangiferihumi]TKI60074.1 hypothetical protein FC756_19840 [Lysinibacillus mangiferihumi]